MVRGTIKRLLVLLSFPLAAVSSAASLEGSPWISHDIGYFSSIQLLFENGTVHAVLSCMTAQGDYSAGGNQWLQIQFNEYDTLCPEGAQYLVDIEGYHVFIERLNSVTTFSITSEGILKLVTGDDYTFEFLELDTTLIYPEELSGDWYSVTSSSHFHFFTNGDFELYDGCNTIWGRYGVSDDSLFWEYGEGTLRACTGPNVNMEKPESGGFTLFDDTLTMTDDYQTHIYTRLKTVSMYKPNPKARYRRNALPPGSGVPYDLKGRAVQSGKSNNSLTGIVLRQSRNGVRATVHVSNGAVR
jgi:hypothetical protein